MHTQPTVYQISRAMAASQQQLAGIAWHDWKDKTKEAGQPRMAPADRQSMETMRAVHRECMDATAFHLMGHVPANDEGELAPSLA